MAQATAEREGCFVFGWSKDGLAAAWFLAPSRRRREGASAVGGFA